MILSFNHHFPLEKSPVAGVCGTHTAVSLCGGRRGRRAGCRAVLGVGGADPGGMGALEMTEKRLLLTSG